MLRLEDRTVPAVFTVTNTDDSGAGSLRQAMFDANANAGADTINFSNLFQNPQTIAITSGQMTFEDLTVDNSVSIVGPGSKLLTLVGSAIPSSTNRFFYAYSAGALAISGMTLSKGNITEDRGGAIWTISNTVQLSDLVFDGNTAGWEGGAVYAQNSALAISDCQFVGNKGGTSDPNRGGGAIVHVGGGYGLNVLRSTFTGNTANGDGGAVSVATGTLSIDACTFDHNESKKNGGAVSVSAMNGNSIITNSTFFGNSCTNSGGAIFNNQVFLSGHGLDLRNSTITDNSATAGGGIIVTKVTGALPSNVSSSVVAGNKAASNFDIEGDWIIGNNNLIGSASPGFSSGTGNLLGVDPMLSPLADNGGPTQTCKPLTGSPLINAGNNAAGLAYDQRGTGFLRVIEGKADIGAYEEQIVPPPRVNNVLINNGAMQRSSVTTIAVTFHQQVNLPTNPADAFQLKRQGDNALVGLTAGVINGPNTVVTLTFSGALWEFGSLADGRYTLTIDASKVSNANGQLDGNGDGTAGDNYELIGDPATNKLFRFFGDADGNGTINSVDFTAFRSMFGLSGPSIFDFNGDNNVTADDFAAFRMRFGLMI
jgi:predicted outer membrane repeat protein